MAFELQMDGFGRILKLDDGRLQGECCCGDVPAPCECPSGLTGDYEIDGYYDGMLTACGWCFTNTGTAWDGTLYYLSACEWEGSGSSIDGKAFQAAYLVLTNLGGSCYWELFVSCLSGIIWQGKKTTGNTPEGTYTLITGCDTTPTLTVAEVAP